MQTLWAGINKEDCHQSWDTYAKGIVFFFVWHLMAHTAGLLKALPQTGTLPPQANLPTSFRRTLNVGKSRREKAGLGQTDCLHLSFCFCESSDLQALRGSLLRRAGFGVVFFLWRKRNGRNSMVIF